MNVSSASTSVFLGNALVWSSAIADRVGIDTVSALLQIRQPVGHSVRIVQKEIRCIDENGAI